MSSNREIKYIEPNNTKYVILREIPVENNYNYVYFMDLTKPKTIFVRKCLNTDPENFEELTELEEEQALELFAEANER